MLSVTDEPLLGETPPGVLRNTGETTMQITHKFLKAHALSCLKQAQSAFNKNPNSSNWDAVTSAMLVHQQVQAVRLPADAENLGWKLESQPIIRWPETIVLHTTGLTIKEILNQHA